MLIGRHLLHLGLATSIALSTYTPPSLAGTEGSIAGTITDPQGIAIPGAQVQLLDENSHLVKSLPSSETGEFQFFPIDFGKYFISIQETGYSPYQTEARVSSGGTTEIKVELARSTDSTPSQATPPSGEEMVMKVSAKKKLVQTTSTLSSTELDQKEIRQLPRGSEISLPSLLTSTTPGAVAGSFGQVFFRGNHASIQYQIDGVQMPDSVTNTFGQAFSPRNIDHMEVITGGVPAEYGQRLAAVVNIITRSGPETPEGEVELNYGSYNTTTPHLVYGGSNESGNVRYFVSANYNRTDRGIDTPQPDSLENQAQGGSDAIHDGSSGNSEFARVDWQVDNSNRLSFIFFNSESFFQIPNYPASFAYNSPYFGTGYVDPFGNHDDDGGPTYKWVPSTTNDSQNETNLYGQVVWKHSFSERAFLQLAPYYKYSALTVTPDPKNDLAINSLVPPGTETEAISFGMNRKVNNLGLKLDYTLRPNDRHVVKTGVQFQASRADGSISIQKDLNSPAIVNSDPNLGYFESIYLQDSFMITQALTLNAGLRFDATQFVYPNTPTDHSSDFLFQPRIGLSYLATETTRLHAFYGKLFQPAGLENLRTTYNAVTGNSITVYDIKAEKDDYYEVGVAQQLGEKQVAQLNLFYKNGINILDDAQLFRTSIAQPFNFATGYAYGAEFSLKGQITPEWSEYLNYSYLIAKGSGISGGSWAAHDHGDSSGDQFMDHAQIHTANAGLTYTRNSFWWSTQGLYGSGLRTGPGNSISLPGHLTFNTTVGYEFRGKSWWSQFKLAGDVINIFDNRYPITLANSYNGSHYAAGRQFFIRLTKSI